MQQMNISLLHFLEVIVLQRVDCLVLLVIEGYGGLLLPLMFRMLILGQFMIKKTTLTTHLIYSKELVQVLDA